MDEMILLMMIVVRGCWIFVLVLVFRVIGRKLSVAINVIILKCDVVVVGVGKCFDNFWCTDMVEEGFN